MERKINKQKALLYWVESKGEYLRSIARDGFEKRGRGVLFINEANLLNEKTKPLYLAKEDAIKVSNCEEFAKDLESYNPNTTILVYIYHKDGSALLIGLDIKPTSTSEN